MASSPSPFNKGMTVFRVAGPVAPLPAPIAPSGPRAPVGARLARCACGDEAWRWVARNGSRSTFECPACGRVATAARR